MKVGMGAGTDNISHTQNDEYRLKYFASTDLRYEVPITKNWSTSAIFGASYYGSEINGDLDSTAALDAGLGVSYVLSKGTGVYLEYTQSFGQDDFKTKRAHVGFKFTF